ncbi:MAG: hypothetical protein AAB545_03190 [Patescibacteria group bacterium]
MKSPEQLQALGPSKPNDLPGKEAPSDSQEQILAQFSFAERKVIQERMRVLSVIPNHIGKDFDMEVELNTPGGGWLEFCHKSGSR